MKVYQALVAKDDVTAPLEAIEGIECMNIMEHDIHSFLDKTKEKMGGEIDLLLLNLSDSSLAQQDHILWQIRSSKLDIPAEIPIYCLNEGPLSNYLADGSLEPSAKLYAQLERFYERQAQLLKQQSNSPLDRFLAYAWPRENFQLTPRWQLQEYSSYQYPLLACLGVQEEQKVLAKWQQADILSEAGLIDRVRQCPRCDSEHLNYVDICPRCKSIDINSSVSLHCFTCGHVGEQGEFQLDTALRCPTCLTQLRHIGVDYDRPLERFHCASCDHRFIEGQVVASCHNGHRQRPDELKERRLYQYVLGPAAEQIASVGRIFDNRALQWGEDTSIENFSWLLRWSNASAQRHQHQHLLLFLNWEGVAEAITQWGEDRAMAQIAELQERLHSVIRQTDVFAQIDADKAVILLCHTSIKWLDQIAAKLASIEAANDDSILKLQVRNFPLPSQDLPENTQQWLLAHANKLELDHVI
ncbi:MAG: diguanylate cyclase [Cellvibrionaceae bacterium]|nr:diguanylate cyclase [Cellvibrionaceae bacterium]